MGTQNKAAAATDGAGARPSNQPLQRAGATESVLRPPVDIYETADEIVLRADMPGVTRERLDIRVDGNNLLIEGSEATLVTSALRWATEHVITVRDKNGSSVERFAASPAYELQVQAFEGELQGRRSNLPDGEDGAYTVAVTNAVLKAIEERRLVPVTDI